jgi:hypothetical protein
MNLFVYSNTYAVNLLTSEERESYETENTNSYFKDYLQ